MPKKSSIKWTKYKSDMFDHYKAHTYIVSKPYGRFYIQKHWNGGYVYGFTNKIELAMGGTHVWTMKEAKNCAENLIREYQNS